MKKFFFLKIKLKFSFLKENFNNFFFIFFLLLNFFFLLFCLSLKINKFTYIKNIITNKKLLSKKNKINKNFKKFFFIFNDNKKNINWSLLGFLNNEFFDYFLVEKKINNKKIYFLFLIKKIKNNYFNYINYFFKWSAEKNLFLSIPKKTIFEIFSKSKISNKKNILINLNNNFFALNIENNLNSRLKPIFFFHWKFKWYTNFIFIYKNNLLNNFFSYFGSKNKPTFIKRKYTKWKKINKKWYSFPIMYEKFFLYNFIKNNKIKNNKYFYNKNNNNLTKEKFKNFFYNLYYLWFFIFYFVYFFIKIFFLKNIFCYNFNTNYEKNKILC